MGFFKVDRQVFDHWLWEDKPFSKGQAWIDLIGLANYEDGKTLYRGKVVDCKRGTVYRSISFLAERWGWSRDKTRNFLNMLESDGMVRIKATTRQTTVTLINYGKFQDRVTTDSSTDSTTDSSTDRQLTIQGKKKNKEYKEHNARKRARRESDHDRVFAEFLELVAEKEREEQERKNDSEGVRRDPENIERPLQAL